MNRKPFVHPFNHFIRMQGLWWNELCFLTRNYLRKRKFSVTYSDINRGGPIPYPSSWKHFSSYLLAPGLLTIFAPEKSESKISCGSLSIRLCHHAKAKYEFFLNYFFLIFMGEVDNARESETAAADKPFGPLFLDVLWPFHAAWLFPCSPSAVSPELG